MTLRLSGVVTTLNNAATLEACLSSLAFCDDRVVLDSGSTDATLDIARRYGARIETQAFAGYGPQKQAAIELAYGEWILLLDADEHLSDHGRDMIERELAAPLADGYRLPRQEWLFWRWPHAGTRANWQLRLFRKAHGRMNMVPVHAAPEVEGRVLDLDAPFRHYGEPHLADRVDKVNRYSTGLVEHKRGKRPCFIGMRLLFYPAVAFLKLYFGKRYFLNGWAGFFAAKTQSFYAFLKYAKVLEAQRQGALHE
ncbi:glycosyltransferase family 2 protein [Thermomonas sp. HDW16]|uniref:glycosyltransferase family 2 protein n=1 Tax=Thermomonas sp. HDW16 TaxID=2714945 RepID=UPI00140749F4|nr:glycosyltransferase family 2 protein [Thermomonas sp. HDW16]QIL19831.1 glycosyltransferase family 2 protein [Thermomonas sp. HDW16]